MRAVIVAGGDAGSADERWLDGAHLIAADSGAAWLLDRGHVPDRLVGDLDSLDPTVLAELERRGVPVDRHPADKEASDAELALEAALAAGADEIVLVGALGGGRLDHELANVLLLADPALAGRDVRLVRGRTTVRCLAGGARLELRGDDGALVTLLPIGGDATGVSTHGLRWALDAATLRLGRSRGLSNELVGAAASVSLARGLLLVIQTDPQGDLHP